MIEYFFLIFLVALASVAVFSNNLQRSIIYMGAFSLILSFAYLFYHAPDVALAEAAIGVGLSTIMYLVTLKKIRIYSICYVEEGIQAFSDNTIRKVDPKILKPVEHFMEKEEELEPQFAYTNQTLQQVLDEKQHDLVILKKDNTFFLYGNSKDFVFRDIIRSLLEVLNKNADVKIRYTDEVTADES